MATGTERASRRRFLRLTVGAGGLTLGAALAAGAPRGALSGSTQARDVEILNYALLLEELQAAFYRQALAKGALSGELREYADVVAGHEREHVELLRDALGGSARKVPRFAFGKAVSDPARFAATALELEDLGVAEDEDAFIRTAVAFEDLGTAAYKGQAYRIESPALLAAAISIHSVEARHAAWIRYLAGAPGSVDTRPSTRSLRRCCGRTGPSSARRSVSGDSRWGVWLAVAALGLIALVVAARSVRAPAVARPRAREPRPIRLRPSPRFAPHVPAGTPLSQYAPRSVETPANTEDEPRRFVIRRTGLVRSRFVVLADELDGGPSEVASSRSFWRFGRAASRERVAEDTWDDLMNELRLSGWEQESARRSDYYVRLRRVGTVSSSVLPTIDAYTHASEDPTRG